MTGCRHIVCIIFLALLRLSVSVPTVGIPSCDTSYGFVDAPSYMTVKQQLETTIAESRLPGMPSDQHLSILQVFGLVPTLTSHFRMPLTFAHGDCFMGIDITGSPLRSRRTTWRQHLDNLDLLKRTCIDYRRSGQEGASEGGWVQDANGFYYVIANAKKIGPVHDCLLEGHTLRQCVDAAVASNEARLVSNEAASWMSLQLH